MDPRSQSQQRKEELVAELDAIRLRIRADSTDLEKKLHPIKRLKAAIRKNPFKAFGIAAGGAFVLSILRRPKPTLKERTFKATLLAGLFSLARPALTTWAIKEAKERFIDPQVSHTKVYQANTP